MATKKTMASTAKKSATSATKAIIVAMAAIAGTNYAQKQAAYQDAMRDMAHEFGRGHVITDYTWDPFDGMLA